jgi:hypothetical protein
MYNGGEPMNMRRYALTVTVACIFFLSGVLANVAFSIWIMAPAKKEWMPKPDYDSGWIELAWAQYSVNLTHNLGTTEVFVDIMARANYQFFNLGERENIHINMPKTGDLIPQQIDQNIYYWSHLTNTNIIIFGRFTGPEGEVRYSFRVRIWKIQ